MLRCWWVSPWRHVCTLTCEMRILIVLFSIFCPHIFQEESKTWDEFASHIIWLRCLSEQLLLRSPSVCGSDAEMITAPIKHTPGTSFSSTAPRRSWLTCLLSLYDFQNNTLSLTQSQEQTWKFTWTVTWPCRVNTRAWPWLQLPVFFSKQLWKRRKRRHEQINIFKVKSKAEKWINDLSHDLVCLLFPLGPSHTITTIGESAIHTGLSSLYKYDINIV